MRHHYLARITPWDTLTRGGWLDEGMTRRGRLGEDHSTRQDDSTRLLWVITRIPKVVRVVCDWVTSVLRIVLTSLLFFFPIIWNVQSIINDIYYGQSIVLIIIDTFHFISFSIIILSAVLPANFVTWMIMVLIACEDIRFSSLFVADDVSRETSSATKSEEKRMFSQAMVLMVFSILFQDHEFNATNCRHRHSCAFSPCVQIYFSTF